MKVAVLPFNATEGTDPALGRQFASYAAETLRAATDADIQSISYLARTEENGVARQSYVNIADTLVEYDFLANLFKEASAEKVMDGLLDAKDDAYKLTVRFNSSEQPEPIEQFDRNFKAPELFGVLRELVEHLAKQADVELPPDLREKFQFGTESPEAYLLFLHGLDGLQYVQQTGGQVAADFDPQPSLDRLIQSYEKDPSFNAPYEGAIQLSRFCAQYRLGSFDLVEATLLKLADKSPNDFRPHFALGEVYQSVDNGIKAVDAYEKAIQFHQKQHQGELEGDARDERVAMLMRLGISQMSIGMPVNAERNFRKAAEMDGESGNALDYLANVLLQTDRAHEVSQLWKDRIAKFPQDAAAHAKYAGSLLQAGREKEAIDAFEHALETVEDNAFIKRFYAPVLAEKDELDRAMDFFEDCMDVAPNDIPLLLEYAQTLAKAEREFEIPKVLHDVLASNPDPNTRAQTLAWLIEIEQPKRAEAVEAAKTKFEAEDFEGTIRELKPLRNWLADYWKLWALLAAAYNRVEEYGEAEDAAQRLLSLFPACEPGYAEYFNALSAQGRMEEAYNVMRHAANNIPNSLGIVVNLAIAAKRAGHDDEAKMLVRQIREAVGPNEELEPILAEIES